MGKIQLTRGCAGQKLRAGGRRPGARRTSPGRTARAATVDLTPDANTPGLFHADWNAEKPGYTWLK